MHVSRPELLGSQHSKTCCHSDNKSIDQEHDSPCTSYCCQCACTDKLTDNHSIRHIIKLLKDIADKNRQSKINDDLHRLS